MELELNVKDSKVLANTNISEHLFIFKPITIFRNNQEQLLTGHNIEDPFQHAIPSDRIYGFIGPLWVPIQPS